jgi:DNA-binding winged helix-turn-helix (wHTH) protein
MHGLIYFADFVVDQRAGELRKAGVKVRLQEQPFRVLAALLEASGEVVTREELRTRLWAADTFVDFDHRLAAAVNKIRDVLDDSAQSPRFIETVGRRGYRFLLPVEWGQRQAESNGNGQTKELAEPPPVLVPVARGINWRRIALVAGALALLLAVVSSRCVGGRVWMRLRLPCLASLRSRYFPWKISPTILSSNILWRA